MLDQIFCVGLTGGIASGKSTVLKFFHTLGIDSVCADQIAKQIIVDKPKLLEQMVAYFGDGILNSDKTLNRKALRSIIFDHPEKRKWLENLLHPVIRGEIKAQIKQTASPYCIVDIPLLTKNHTYDYLDYIVTIDLPEVLQISRLLHRDQTTIDAAYQIINSQLKRAERYTISDYILQNLQNENQLKTQVETLHQHLLKLIAKKLQKSVDSFNKAQ